MTFTLGRRELDRFRSLVETRLGLAFDDGKLDYLADVLRGRTEGPGKSPMESYLGRLAGPVDWREEWRLLAERLTVAETYFFRYWDHFRAFSELVLPPYRKPEGGTRPLRVLSAGCASGEEAYSLAMLIREQLGDSGATTIQGIDVNPSIVEKARKGRYSTWSLRDTPSKYRDLHFRGEGKEFVLDPAIRSMVTFDERNLIDPDPVFWQPGSFDVVFCRNVTMYFPLDVTRAVIARIARSLSPEGYLFLGHTETLRGVTEGFHLRHTHDTFYYQLRGDREPPAIPSIFSAPSSAEPSGPSVGPLESGESWFDVIQRATARIAALANPPEAVASAASPTTPALSVPLQGPSPWDRSVVLDLLRQERFSEALTLLSTLPTESNRDPDAQLLRAVLLTNGGDVVGATEICRQILEGDDLHAGAHYLMALCLEQAGDRLAAVEHDQTAVYLDPTFAMPRFHLGLLAKRQGSSDGARRDLEHALTLLVREDASRILLFGGGFSRDVLMELCRGEIRSCGGAP
ncbi:MAG TPA: CheR family methyltransferase [Planctomycetota bacterium]|nr:CheR family methyltransferase [Planctomycetota bacterium]